MKNYKFISQLNIDDEIKIRQFEESDIDEHYTLVDRNREHLSEWMLWAEKATKESTLEFVKKSCKHNLLGKGTDIEDGRSVCDCAIIYDNQIVGSTGLMFTTEKEKIEIGYWLGKDYNGKGIMSRTVIKVIKYCLEVLKFNNVLISVDIRNKKSQAVAERIGKYYKTEVIKEEGKEDHISYYFDKSFLNT